MSTTDLKVIILAAGGKTIGEPPELMVLQKLGEQRILDYVVDKARRLAAPQDILIVVGRHKEAVMAYLGPAYQYVEQPEPLGTGHAMLQTRPFLAHFTGNLLILYGDTPLFRRASMRGLLNRHRLKGASLTMLTAVTNHDYPYGRIIRDGSGRIIDIVEAREASPDVLDIRELNVGAYVVGAPTIFPALAALTPSPADGEYRLTDCVYQLIRSGLRVDSYQIYDEDEIQGINTPADLGQAAFILQKRLFRPRRHEEENRVAFGTGGWRAVIGEGFTLHNVRRLCQALTNEVTRRSLEKRGVVIGYDRRFLSEQAGEAAAEVFAGNNIHAILLSEDAPTPLITFATDLLNSAYGLAFTASHNPPQWNGLKVFHGDGSLLLDEETRQIEDETNALSLDNVVKLPLDVALAAGIVQRRDFTNEYVDAVEKFIDLEAIRAAGLKVIVDPMYGVGQLTLGIILTEARCRVTFIHERRNPLFGGRSPAPDLEALRLLSTHVVEDSYDLGLATDGDADRIAIVDEKGQYVTTNDILLLLYYYLHQVRGERGGVVRNLATTHLLDRLAAHLGEISHEVPVGFKHIAASMVTHDALLGGESSGGLTIRGHILGKDGIFAAALIIEMLAKTGQTISELRRTVYGLTGTLYSLEDNVPATPAMRVLVPRRVGETAVTHIAGYKVERISHLDGIKFYLENDNWLLLRFSGTEPVLRLFAEADSPEKARELLDYLKGFLGTGD
ncbi:MAG: NTP transferase domain-containing protein [Chloroflexi bacterium]|nr:NTP transferase domain-containing protein [Chloroflexota bacterium]MBP7045212.1 NTP transferase domain-containing protein [Chloroflexota bacterium]